MICKPGAICASFLLVCVSLRTLEGRPTPSTQHQIRNPRTKTALRNPSNATNSNTILDPQQTLSVNLDTSRDGSEGSILADYGNGGTVEALQESFGSGFQSRVGSSNQDNGNGTPNENPSASGSNDGLTAYEPMIISGGNTRTISVNSDGLKIDTISATPHILSIQRNLNPPSAQFVTSTDPSRNLPGGQWLALTDYSYIMSFQNETPDDMIMRMSVPYGQFSSGSQNDLDGDVYIGMFDPKRGGWVIDPERTENRRSAKEVNLFGISAATGEYRLLGRAASQTTDQSNSYLTFGQDIGGQFNVMPPPQGLPAPPLQVGTWQDGSKVMIRSTESMTIRMEINNISTNAIPVGYQTASQYGFLITSSSPGATVATHLQMPYVPTHLRARDISPDQLVVAGRPLGTTQKYQLLSSTTMSGNGVLMNTPMTMVDGEYVLLAPSKAVKRQNTAVNGVPNTPLNQQTQTIGAQTSTTPGTIQTGTSNNIATTQPGSNTLTTGVTSTTSVSNSNVNSGSTSFFGNPGSSGLSVQQVGGTSTRISESQNSAIQNRVNNEFAQQRIQNSSNNQINNRVTAVSSNGSGTGQQITSSNSNARSQTSLNSQSATDSRNLLNL